MDSARVLPDNINIIYKNETLKLPYSEIMTHNLRYRKESLCYTLY